MKPARQLKLHDPDNGVLGSCWATCIAMVLGLDPEDVPNFVESDDWWGVTTAWLEARGYTLIEVRGDAVMVPAEGAVLIASGPSPRDVQHSVVDVWTQGHWVEYDPHPSDAGLLERQTFSMVVRHLNYGTQDAE